MRIEINACRFLVNKMISKGSQGYICWNEDDTCYSEISWSEVLKWLDGFESTTKNDLGVLEKIRAEILEEHENAYAREDNDVAYGLSVALDIIDKYKAEQ